ncbi:MAG: CBS domain-containing protein, partial [Rhodospirillales bacterium]|nr:CBS domain-containing protein [Rhodospirillales bacterium]
PLLIMGGALGGVAAIILPAAAPGFWALIGMAAMMGGMMRAPLTAIIFALELTHDVDAILPLAVGCALAHTTTVLLLRRSILTEKVARRGHHISREYIADPFETMRVADIMARPVDHLPAAMPVAELLAFFTDARAPARHKSYPVLDQRGRLVGMVARADVLRWTMTGWPKGETLGALVDGRGDAVIGYDDEPVGALADRMAARGVGRVPVLRRRDNALVGLVARRDLLAVRASVVREERERSVLMAFGRGK